MGCYCMWYRYHSGRALCENACLYNISPCICSLGVSDAQCNTTTVSCHCSWSQQISCHDYVIYRQLRRWFVTLRAFFIVDKKAGNCSFSSQHWAPIGSIRGGIRWKLDAWVCRGYLACPAAFITIGELSTRWCKY